MNQPHYCNYCKSNKAQHREHVIPQSYSNNHSFRGTIWSCEECNTLLGNIAYHTIETRAAYLHGRIKQKYSKLLKSPIWTKEELKEMGRSMKTYIKHQEQLKKIVLLRLTNLEELGLQNHTKSQDD